MSEQSRRPSSASSLPFAPVLLLIAVTGAGYLSLTATLESRRPTAATDQVDPPTPPGPQGFETQYSRLWQDPFSTVYSADDTSAPRAQFRLQVENKQVSLEWKPSGTASELEHIQKQVQARYEEFTKGENDGKRILCMPVFVPGGPYVETREQRRRTRYAVLTALGDSGYSLKFAERMSYIKLPVRVQTGPTSQQYRQIDDFVVPVKLHSRKSIATASATARSSEYASVWVLWINESQLGVRPLASLAQILDQFFGKVRCEGKVDLAIIGPSSSDQLLSMARDDAKWGGKEILRRHEEI